MIKENRIQLSWGQVSKVPEIFSGAPLTEKPIHRVEPEGESPGLGTLTGMVVNHLDENLSRYSV